MVFSGFEVSEIARFGVDLAENLAFLCAEWREGRR
jgi:hypothetical protein